jgi:Cu-Zn family superoxide dismutase
MRKMLTFASLLAVTTVACAKDKQSSTMPASALEESEEAEKEVATTPTEPVIEEETPMVGEEPLGTEPGTEPIAGGAEGEPGEEETIGEPSSEVLAGRSGAMMSRETVFVDPGATEPMAVEEVVAVLAPTKGNKVKGTVRFRAVGDGLEVTTDVTGLKMGKHAFHVHVFGDCSSPDGESAGEHFNFSGSSLAPTEKIITGDLGELTADRTGKATLTANVPQASLQGKFSIVGRAVVIHEKANDPNQTPDGGAGKRLACGVIGIAHEDTASTPSTTTTPATPTSPTPTAPPSPKP